MRKEQVTDTEDMQTLFVADKTLGELEALFACDVSDDDDFYDVLAFNLTRIEPRYFLGKLATYSGPRLRGAVFGLGRSSDRGPEQKAALAALLNHSDPLIVTEAIDELAELGDRRAIDAIRRFLKDSDEDVRLAAASAINTLSSQP